MPSSGMLRRVAFVRRDFSEELSTSIIILVTLMKEVLRSSETSVLTKVTWRTIPEDGILHGDRRENLKSYIHCPIHNSMPLYPAQRQSKAQYPTIQDFF
jgi:hypothetical protein